MNIQPTDTDRIVREMLARQSERKPCIEVVDDVMTEVLKAKTAWQRLQIANGMWRTARVMVTATVRSHHPDWDPASIEREVARRLSHGMV